RGVAVEEKRFAHTAQLVHRREWLADALFHRARRTGVRLSRPEQARFVADCPREDLKGADVALSRQQETSAAVVPNGARLFLAVSTLELSEVVVAEEQLDALPRTARRVAGETRDAGEVRGFVERK